MVTRGDLQAVADAAPDDAAAPLAAILKTRPIVAYPDESLRMIVYRMAETGLTRFPVVDREHRRLIGMIALTDLLKARALNLDAEQRRERVLGAHISCPFGNRTPEGSTHMREGHVSMPRDVPAYAGRSLTGCGGGSGNDAFAPPCASPFNSASRLGYAYIVGAWSCINPPVSAVGP